MTSDKEIHRTAERYHLSVSDAGVTTRMLLESIAVDVQYPVVMQHPVNSTKVDQHAHFFLKAAPMGEWLAKKMHTLKKIVYLAM